MIMPVKLSVPASEAFRALGVDAVAKYAELCGCQAPAVAAMAEQVAAELGSRAAAAGPEADLLLECRSDQGQVDVLVHGPGPAVTVHCAIP